MSSIQEFHEAAAKAKATPGKWVVLSSRVKCIQRHGSGRVLRWYLDGRASSKQKCFFVYARK